jgi:predicted nucleic acid-binding Zn ribbon protein
MASVGRKSGGGAAGGGGRKRPGRSALVPAPVSEPPPRGGGPVSLASALGHLFASKGFSRALAATELDRAWATAVGPAVAPQTKVGSIRHGVLTVTVSHPTLLSELSSFRKAALLASLRQTAPGSAVQDLKFRVGRVD